MVSVNALSNRESMDTEQDAEGIQIAVLAESYSFEDMKVDMAMDGKFLLRT